MDNSENGVESALSDMDYNIAVYDAAVKESGNAIVAVEERISYAIRDGEPHAELIVTRSTLIRRQRTQIAKLLGCLVAERALQQLDDWYPNASQYDCAELALTLVEKDDILGTVMEAADDLPRYAYVPVGVSGGTVVESACWILRTARLEPLEND